MKTWFITGASRGFGLELTRQALERGDSVVATARDPRVVEKELPGYDDRLLAVALDVTDEEQAAYAVQAAVERFGSIDVLVNNAGRGLVGAIEETSDAEARAVFDTNVFGLLTVTRAVLPVLRKAGSGRIINFSSTGGVVAWPGWGVYSATKFAVEGISEALRAEVAPLGIQVTSLQPGPFRTNFLDGSSLHRATTELTAYAGSGGDARTWADGANYGQEGDPVKGAAAVLVLADLPQMPARLPLGTSTVNDIRTKVATVSAELDEWEELARSTDHVE